MFYIYVFFMGLVGIVAGIVLAARAKKADDVIYVQLDKVGKITNIVLIPVYAIAGTFCMVIASLFSPNYGGFLGVIGWIVSVIGGTAPALWAPGLGLSVALRKKGKSKQSFWVQFVGMAGFALTLLIFFAFYGNLLDTLN